MIRTKQDVFDHFGVEDDEGLDRALYKYTECGAWGKVETVGVYEKRTSVWTAKYTRCQGEWSLQGIYDAEGKAVAPVVKEVVDYFWPDVKSLQEDLEAVLGSGMEASHSAEIEWTVRVGDREIFSVGSIVEGIEREARTQCVYLPCSSEDLDQAVADVEEEARLIWMDTHGCEECAKRNGWEWPGCAVDEECPECEGIGISI